MLTGKGSLEGLGLQLPWQGPLPPRAPGTQHTAAEPSSSLVYVSAPIILGFHSFIHYTRDFPEGQVCTVLILGFAVAIEAVDAMCRRVWAAADLTESSHS